MKPARTSGGGGDGGGGASLPLPFGFFPRGNNLHSAELHSVKLKVRRDGQGNGQQFSVVFGPTDLRGDFGEK